MIAPRTKSWSSPLSVVDCAVNLFDLLVDDVVYDVGCGDGRVLVSIAERVPGIRCIGVEIDQQRADAAVALIENQLNAVNCRIICGNALEQTYNDATGTKMCSLTMYSILSLFNS